MFLERTFMIFEPVLLLQEPFQPAFQVTIFPLSLTIYPDFHLHRMSHSRENKI